VKKRIPLILIIIILAISSISNPNRNTHQDAIIKQYKEQNPISGILFVGDTLAKSIKYENYIVFSRTKILEQLISTGYFGIVFVRDLELISIIKNALKK
jgi:hypothetical protein